MAKYKLPKWSKEDDQIIINLYTNGNQQEILKLLPNRNWSSIKQRAHKLKIFRPRGYRFTDEMIEYLIRNYPTTTDSELSKYIGCTIPQVGKKCKILGLKKNPEFVLNTQRELRKKLCQKGSNHRFKKGNIPPNKGKKMEEFMTSKQMEVFKLNQKKAGDRSSNWVPVGSESLTKDGYVMVKVAEGKFQWRLKHRITWEKHNGPIPKGYNVQFKDRNRLNCDDIDNLYLIHRAEQCNINSIHRYPKEIKKAIRALGELNKQIKKHETN